MKSLKELRDDAAFTFSIGKAMAGMNETHNAGFDAGAKAVMEKAQALVDALEWYDMRFSREYKLNNGVGKDMSFPARLAISDWAQFIGEVKE